MNQEVALLNHILKTKDILSPLNADVEKSFLLHLDEWNWIKEYYMRYREVPAKEDFYRQFEGFEPAKTEGVIEFYIDELHKAKAHRELQTLLTESAIALRETGPYSVLNKIQKATAQLGRDTKMVKDLDLVANSNERLESLKSRIALRASGRTILGIPSGFHKLDMNFGGFQKGDLVVLAGWTGSLKSWLALKMAVNAWLAGARILYFSLELSGEQIGYRVDTLLAGGEFKNSALTHATEDITYDRYKNWLGTTMSESSNPFVVVTNESLDEVNQNTVLAKIEHWKPDLTVLDYHGLFDDASGAIGEVEKTKNLSKAFKRIAMKTGCPIIDITAVTQDKKDLGNTPPELHDLAWSKQLAYDSDLTLGLCKHGDTLEVVSRKTRRCKEFKFFLNWDVDSGKVKEMFAGQHEDDEDE
jgi:replicative DNA helicase